MPDVWLYSGIPFTIILRIPSRVGSCDQCAFVHWISVLSIVSLPIIAWYPTLQIILYFTLLRKTNLFDEMRLPSDVELQRASTYLNLQPIPILVSISSPPTSTGTWSHQFWSLLGILCCKLGLFVLLFLLLTQDSVFLGLPCYLLVHQLSNF